MKNISLLVKVLGEAAISCFKSRVKHLILHVTKRCNMRCEHCFVDIDNFNDDLSIGEIKSIAQHFSDLIWLDIGGGEPLLRDDLEEIISQFNFREIAIPTNGWDVRCCVEKLKRIHLMTSGKLIIALSLEGMQKTHDEIRCPTSFERTIEAFYGLSEIKGIRIKFNTVLCEKNYSEVIDLMHFVKELKPDFHSILMLRGKPRNPIMRLPPIDKIRALEKKIFRIQRSYGYGHRGVLSLIQRNYQAYKADLSSKILEEKRQVIPCLAGTTHLVVWSEGNVSPCELLPPVGNIRKESLGEILTGAEIKKAISSIKNGDCFCTHDCNMIENTLFNPKSYWKLLWL